MTQSFFRAIPSAWEQPEPRTLTGRLVPYNEAALVLDFLPDGRPEVYREGFRPGAFARQAGATEPGVLAKIALRHRHGDDGLGFLGNFVHLREAPDGLWGDVQILRSRADDVEDLLASGVGELSIEFTLPVRGGPNTELDANGTRWRTRAHLDQVALEPKGAYSSAQVISFRAELDEEAVAAAERRVADEAEAERIAAAAAADDEAAVERQRAEADAEAALERRRRWDELTGRLPAARAQQDAYHRRYGTTRKPARPL